MSIYAISDLHLSFDPRIRKPMDVFGTAWVDHADRVKAAWEAAVSPEDTVLVPGDLSWGLRLDEALADLEWIHRLPGRKIFVKGNHDLWWTSPSQVNALHEDMIFLQNHAAFAEGAWICGTRGWVCPGTDEFSEHDERIYRRELIRLRFSLEEARQAGAEDIIAMLHYPPTNDRFQPSGFTDLLTEFGVRTCVYGHLHGQDNFRRGLRGEYGGVDYHLVSLDAVGAQPVKIRPIEDE